MKSSKLANAVILLALFAVGCLLFKGCDSGSQSEESSTYVPPAP